MVEEETGGGSVSSHGRLFHLREREMRSLASKPRDAQLAGLVEVRMCFQVLAGNKSLETLGLPSSKCSTNVLSDHACV